MTTEKQINILNESIIAIENNKYEAKFINGGYTYSDNITNILKLLKIYQNTYIDNINRINKDTLIKDGKQDNFTLLECIVYFTFLWHLEGSGISIGIINSKIKLGEYLKALNRFKELLQMK